MTTFTHKACTPHLKVVHHVFNDARFKYILNIKSRYHGTFTHTYSHLASLDDRPPFHRFPTCSNFFSGWNPGQLSIDYFFLQISSQRNHFTKMVKNATFCTWKKFKGAPFVKHKYNTCLRSSCNPAACPACQKGTLFDVFTHAAISFRGWTPLEIGSRNTETQPCGDYVSGSRDPVTFILDD